MHGEFTVANVVGLLQAYAFGAEGSSSRWSEGDDTVPLRLPKRDIKEKVRRVLATLQCAPEVVSIM